MSIPIPVLDGRFFQFYDESNFGAVRISCYFRNGLLDGDYTEYSYDGVVILHMRYDQGKKEGRQTRRYPSGNIQSICNFVNDELDGTIIEYEDIEDIDDNDESYAIGPPDLVGPIIEYEDIENTDAIADPE